MSRKSFIGFKATVPNGTVQLSAYKASPAFENSQQGADAFSRIRIWRKAEPDFVFGEDYAEYFDGLSRCDAEVIFEGALCPADHRKCVYIDQSVAVGTTYVYWLGLADKEPVGPVAVKVRDPEVWWSQARIGVEMQVLRKRYPDLVKVETIGRTVRGVEIPALCVGKGEPRIGFVGAVHAGESGAELILPAIASVLAEHRELVEQVGIAAVPVVNIDEREKLVRGTPWYLRTNANGVDLNRNFPSEWEHISEMYGLDSSDSDSATYRGRAAASEPETQALMQFLSAQKLVGVFSFHCLASICGLPLLAPQCARDDAEFAGRCQKLGMTYAEGLSMGESFDPALACRFGTSQGSLATWCYRELGVPAFDLELSPSFDAAGLAQARIDRTDQPLLDVYRNRHAHALIAMLASVKGQA